MMRCAILLSLVLTCWVSLVPADSPKPLPHHLVDVKAAMPDAVLDVHYATTKNFTKTQLYPFAAVYLHKDALQALMAVQKDLRKQGLGIKLFDGYRPLSVQQKMWDLIQDSRYVSNPAVNRGRHTRGTAIDLTLIDAEGIELPMPTGYDDFTEKAHQDAKDVTPEQAKNRKLLRDVMVKHGFEIYPYEWWHFDLKGWKEYPVLDIGFEELKEERKKG